MSNAIAGLQCVQISTMKDEVSWEKSCEMFVDGVVLKGGPSKGEFAGCGPARGQSGPKH